MATCGPRRRRGKRSTALAVFDASSPAPPSSSRRRRLPSLSTRWRSTGRRLHRRSLDSSSSSSAHLSRCWPPSPSSSRRRRGSASPSRWLSAATSSVPPRLHLITAVCPGLLDCDLSLVPVIASVLKLSNYESVPVNSVELVCNIQSFFIEDLICSTVNSCTPRWIYRDQSMAQCQLCYTLSVSKCLTPLIFLAHV
uniref:Uncharacterized protein n=1 Tax=Oryza nivara TaxID=4536 RepID=A0A0E0GD16_ORYNI